LKRITVFVGHYGSGKTELAVNYAIKLSNLGKKVLIVDVEVLRVVMKLKMR
jgi:Mrp family chromosome partitioning ATPase